MNLDHLQHLYYKVSKGMENKKTVMALHTTVNNYIRLLDKRKLQALTLELSEGKSWRLCFRWNPGSEPILLCLPFMCKLAVSPCLGEPSPPTIRHPIIWFVPNASLGHQASDGIGWSLEGTLSEGCKCLLNLLSGGMGGGLSGGGGGGSRIGGGGAGRGLSCFLTIHGED